MHPAYLVRIDATAGTLTYDVIQFLTGEEAVRAYQSDNPGDEGGPPNDYYIVNENPKVRTHSVKEDACLAIFRNGGPNSGTFLPDLASLSAALASEPRDASGRFANPFWVTKESGRITGIRQQWVP